MCGVAGLVDIDGVLGRDDLARRLAAMVSTLAHRGPDDEGTFLGEGVGLGHRRLAVVDLSPRGHQPMVSHDERFVISFNGMIYNFRELRARLRAAGVRFRGLSDTEVLVEAWARWGARVTLDALNGMFALAVWDRAERTVTLARDRLGEKPLYFVHDGETLGFASEVRALAALPSSGRELAPEVVAQMLRWSFGPGPDSVWRGVRQLGPGEVLLYGPRDRRPRPQRWWSIATARARAEAAPFRGPDDEVVDRTESLVADAVRLRLASDVPLGTFLSGGVDSTLVTAMAAAAGGTVRSFTVAMAGGGDLDESEQAAAIARHLGTDHTTVVLRPEDVLGAVTDLARVYDEPFGDPSAVPVLALARATRRHVSVALSGDGGDELFGGYNRYAAAARVHASVAGVPRPLRLAAAGVVRAVPVSVWRALATGAGRVRGRSGVPDLGSKVHRAADVVGSDDLGDAWSRLAQIWPEPPVRGVAVAPAKAPAPGLRDLMQRDQEVTLPDDMLTKVDRATMSVALEARVPLLDHRLLEWSWRLPSDALVRHGRGKWVLRQVLDRHVPAALTDRPKAGFDPPLHTWLRGPLRAWAEERLSVGALEGSGLLDPAPVRRVWRAHLSGRADHTYRLWSVLMLQSWLDEQKGRIQ